MPLSQHAPSLRAINYRVSSTPTKDLPRSAPQVAASLWAIKDLLSASPETLGPSNELATLTHRFRTTLSSLLQDRTIEGRWAAVVLTKAAIEAGGVESLSRSGIWVKSLLTILKKPDPPTTRILATITLTRIFSLTWDHSQLVREITTPALPTFITTCLSNLAHKRCSAGELQAVLDAFASLVPRHPTIFRTHEANIRKILMRVLSGLSSDTSSGLHHDPYHIRAAQRLLALLHYCAPRQGGFEKWELELSAAVSAAHNTCDLFFRPVVESRARPQDTASTTSNGKVAPGVVNDDSLGLPPWEGVYAGSERLMILLGVIEAYVNGPTSSAVKIPIGLISELIRRILAVTAPSSDSTRSMKLNPEVARDEREAMFSILPGVHVATLRVADTLFARLGSAVSSIFHDFMQTLAQLFAEEYSDASLRKAVYATSRAILQIAGPSLSKEQMVDIVPIVRGCCDDLLTVDGTAKDLQSSAASLLPLCFSRIDQAHLPRQVRVQMERTAIFTNQREALVACVMNPPRKDGRLALQPSLMPILARLHPAGAETEALLRPRMPIMVTSTIERDGDGAHSMIASEWESIGKSIDRTPEQPFLNMDSASHEPNGAAIIDAEDLYSSTPELAAQIESMDAKPVPFSLYKGPQQAMKRQAIDFPDVKSAVKRQRASPSRGQLVPGPVTSFHGSHSTIERIESPPDGDGREVAIAEQQAPRATTAQASYDDTSEELRKEHVIALQASGGDNSEDSEFEMPEINPEPDTDPEDEEEEGIE